MNGFLASMAVVLSLISSLGQDPDALVRQRIDRIENGLIEFSSPKKMFQVGGTPSGSLKTLAERMAHYHTPGVSIAVIDDFALDWARVWVLSFMEKGTPSFFSTRGATARA